MEPSPPRIAVYPGSFDPITLGHLNVIERASRLFDRLIVGVGINIEKQAMFTAEERVELIRAGDLPSGEHRDPHVSGAGRRFRAADGARVMVRGVRPITDIAAELTMMMANRRLAPDIETLFMIADGELAHVSSSLIKQIAALATRRGTGAVPAAKASFRPCGGNFLLKIVSSDGLLAFWPFRFFSACSARQDEDRTKTG